MGNVQDDVESNKIYIKQIWDRQSWTVVYDCVMVVLSSKTYTFLKRKCNSNQTLAKSALLKLEAPEAIIKKRNGFVARFISVSADNVSYDTLKNFVWL